MLADASRDSTHANIAGHGRRRHGGHGTHQPISLFVTCRHVHQHAAILFCRPVVCSTQCRKANGKGSIIFTFDTCGKHLALWAIRAYQRHLSPWKGFRCAYRVLTGRDSCSAYGYRVIERHGLRTGLPLLQRRLRACGERHRQHRELHPQARRSGRRQAQAGYCDCDVPMFDCACDCADVASLADCSRPGRGKKPTWFRNGYTASAALKRQQEEHRKKIRQGQTPES
ncbi:MULTISPECIES: membrane protein insertion efficiency factor YidD [unclassified Janthinobacterium]|uniref:membrane protein insertion efficiency factor YidD n=1 Tax=unclassified Janthinobacterium TaxID=2610881 RepID=UPI001E3327C7|nr:MULTISPECIES: membrane protein insertion efficiency factor YidD [unclassified Janthinobacterium]MCC7643806.1 membrane protein insertion efficiency factor YidD [Janthinobacterium sp. EB271-G4-3-1]MCC7691117.1 membrane protein insertion efficiency factor YidD [Janthinobacterium sp. EB271-G4-3-2]